MKATKLLGSNFLKKKTKLDQTSDVKLPITKFYKRKKHGKLQTSREHILSHDWLINQVKSRARDKERTEWGREGIGLKYQQFKQHIPCRGNKSLGEKCLGSLKTLLIYL